MIEQVFKIKNLICEYQKGNPILSIDELEIPRGKLIFVIGKSGIGKSTLIETLGLMNNTIAQKKDSSILFFSDKERSGKELENSWNSDKDLLAQFRKENFSFIFQNTNLMPNFSSGENMMVSLLIQGYSLKEAKEKVLSVMAKLSLPEEIFDKKITELSGGQRQRLAFVRAVTANFSVLFGDEPTGNLDDATASDLMGILKENLVDEKRTGIIVSHDLKLAINFADIIVPITVHDNEGEKVGQIKPNNIITKSNGGWNDFNSNPISNTIEFLKKYLSTKDLLEVL